MSVPEDWFERIWEFREEVLYPSLFGESQKGIYPIPWERLHKGDLTDPRWSTYGVLIYSPTKTRRSYVYVSSGLSNAWFDSTPNGDGISGFGCEFLIETACEADWAIQRIHQLMVYQISLCVGRYPGYQVLDYGFRVPFGSPIDFAESGIAYALLVEPEHCGFTFAQESGSASFLQVVGITEVERDFAKSNSNEALASLLRQHTSYPLTDPLRKSVVT